jgi:hypothetical protein
MGRRASTPSNAKGECNDLAGGRWADKLAALAEERAKIWWGRLRLRAV